MPFRFTIMTAARTAWGRENVTRVTERFLEAGSLYHPGTTHPDWPSTWVEPILHPAATHTNLNPWKLIRKF